MITFVGEEILLADKLTRLLDKAETEYHIFITATIKNSTQCIRIFLYGKKGKKFFLVFKKNIPEPIFWASEEKEMVLHG